MMKSIQKSISPQAVGIQLSHVSAMTTNSTECMESRNPKSKVKVGTSTYIENVFTLSTSGDNTGMSSNLPDQYLIRLQYVHKYHQQRPRDAFTIILAYFVTVMCDCTKIVV